jgi:hypothetical protein
MSGSNGAGLTLPLRLRRTAGSVSSARGEEMKLSETLTERAARLLAENRPARAGPAPSPAPIDLTTGRRNEVAINVRPGGLVPPPTASITSRDSGSNVDHVRAAILALQAYAEGLHDDVELQAVHKCIVALQGILADHARDRSAAMGESPAMRHVRRVSRGPGY